MRAFVAVEISEAIRSALAELITGLRRHKSPVKWVEPGNVHLTLKFLGSVPDETVPAVVEILQQCVHDVAPFRLEVRGVGGFPNLRRPRVLFLGASDDAGDGAGAREIARRLNREMTRADVPREDRPFRYHITVGRVRRPGPLGAVVGKLEELGEWRFGSMRVDRIVLVQSRLTPEGPIYTPVERVELAAESDAASQ